MSALALLACTVIIYLPAIKSGFIWDDDDNVTNNSCLRDVAGLAAIWFKPGATQQYYPLTHTSFWVEYQLWGLNPRGYHLTNVLLHAAAALVLWRVLLRLNVPGAGLAAAVFLLHPVCVESVAWITQRKNALSGLFYLLAANAYLRFDPPGGDPPVHRHWRGYALAAVLFLLALLGKTATCTLPVALAVVYWWKRRRLSWSTLWPLLPLLAMAGALGAVTARVESQSLGAVGPDWDLTAIQRCLVAGRIVWFYPAKVFWPGRISFIYPRWDVSHPAWWWYLYPLSVIAALGGMVLLRRKIGKGPAAAAVIFCVSLLPVLGFVNVYGMRFSYVADHWQYLACMVPIAVGCAVLVRLAGRLGSVGRSGMDVLALVILVALAATTWQQTKIYRNSEVLWHDTLTKNPDCWIAHSNLGTLYHLAYFRAKAEGNNAAARTALDKAAVHCLRAAQLRSDVPQSQYSLGVVYADLGRYAEAIVYLRKALELPLASPQEAAPIHWALGRSLVSTGKVDEGIAHYREAISLNRQFPEAYYYLGVVLTDRGRWDEAEDIFRQAVAVRPDIPELQRGLGGVLEKKGDLAGAAECYQTILAAYPDDGLSHRGLALVLARLGKVREATAEFNESIRLIGLDHQAAAEFRRILQETASAQTQSTSR